MLKENTSTNNICTHEGGPLADGTLEGYEVECPWHGSKFEVRTGEVKNPPATEPEPTYKVKIEGTDILLKRRTRAAEVSGYNRHPAYSSGSQTCQQLVLNHTYSN
jgi:Rieske Fe-S protein